MLRARGARGYSGLRRAVSHELNVNTDNPSMSDHDWCCCFELRQLLN
jgi:hypothetical protein